MRRYNDMEGERIRIPSLHQYDYNKQPIPMYYGKCEYLPAFVNLLFPLSGITRVGAALTHDVLKATTRHTSRDKMCDHYGREIVDQSLSVWSALKNPPLTLGHY